MWKTLLLTFVIAGALAAETKTETNETKEAGGAKEETAGGHFYGNAGYGYQPPPPPPGFGFGNPWGHIAPPLVDDYVCDIDASVLVVTNAGNEGGGYGGNDNYGNSGGNPYGGEHHHHHHHNKPNADRLKCAVIANFDEATCTSCCRIAARRDRSIPSKSVIGFIVDETQLDYAQNESPAPAPGPGPYRAKRGAAAPPPPVETYGVPGAASPPRTGLPPPPPVNPRPVPFYPPIPLPPTVIVSAGNPLGPKARCVCCAPRKFGFPHFPPPPPSYY